MFVIYADEAHCVLNGSPEEDQPVYSVPVGDRIAIDVSGYVWLQSHLMRERVGGTLVVHIIMNGGYYKEEWPAGETRLSIETDGLIPMQNYPPFPGFIPGQFIIAIGVDEVLDDSVQFSPLWCGTVEVVSSY